MTLDDLLLLEKAFWRAARSRAAYSAHLADDSVHIFPGWGVTSDNERVLQAVESAEPWVAHRAGQDEYVAAMTSVYRETRDGWKLVIHQQTPL